MAHSGSDWQRSLFDTYYSYVYAIVLRILRDRGSLEDVEECTADVFADVILRYDTIAPESLKAYIGTTARHKAINASRALAVQDRRTIPLEQDVLTELPARDDTALAAEESELAQLLVTQITALGEPDATILIRKFYYDCTSQEIARELHMTPVAVRGRCRRALAKLRERLTAAGITL